MPTPTMASHRKWIPLVVAAALLVAACGSSDSGSPTGGSSPDSSTPAEELIPVSIRLDAFYLSAHVPLLSGIQQGIFERHGLDVEARPGNGSTTTIQLLANGSEKFGFADGGTFTNAAAQGVATAKMIFGLLQRSPMVIISRAEDGITEPKDLEGKTGGFTTGSSVETIFPAFAAKTGIDESTIRRLPADLATRDSLFVQGETDFTFGFKNSQVPLIEDRCDCELSVIAYADYGVSPIASGFLVNTAYAEANPEVVRKFAAAMREAMEFATENPAAAVADFFTYAGDDTQASEQVITQGWEFAMDFLRTDATEDLPFGCMAEEDWQSTIELLTEYGSVEEGTLTPAQLFDNAYLPDC